MQLLGIAFGVAVFSLFYVGMGHIERMRPPKKIAKPGAKEVRATLKRGRG